MADPSTVHAHHEMVEQLYAASRSGRRWMISSYADFEAGVEEAGKVITAFLGVCTGLTCATQAWGVLCRHVETGVGVCVGRIRICERLRSLILDFPMLWQWQ